MVAAKILIILTILSANIASLRASECSVCSATTQMACVSETQYQACVNGVASGSVNSCPNDYICSTTTSVTCHDRSSSVPASCSSCGICDATSTFACTGSNTYALCLGSNIPSTTATGSCGAGLVCNIDLPNICGDPLAGIEATCTPAADIPNSTPIPSSTYAQDFCKITQINSRFAVPADTTNKNYIYCFLTPSGTWSGQIYTCAGSTHFDSHSQYCIDPKVGECQ